MVKVLSISFLLLLCIIKVTGSMNGIASGVPWYDTDGNRIEAHGAGLLAVGNTFYLYGESKKLYWDPSPAINCYSSTDLYNWKYEGQVLTHKDIHGLPIEAAYLIMERPKVIYNNKTEMYVMWFHLDNNPTYKLKSVGVAVSKTPNGHFTFVSCFQPDGLPSLDQTLFQDDNGDAYHLRSVRNSYIGISKLTDDYLNTTSDGIISRTQWEREAPAMFKHEGIYYLVTSHCSGWAPNAMELYSGGSVLKKGTTWASLGNPTNHPTTFDSQSTNVFIYKNTIMYQGDRWNQAGRGGLLNATYIWLPMIPDGKTFKIEWQNSWNLP